MNILDIRTVVFSQLITDVLCTTVLTFLWLQNRKRYAGIFFWVADFIFQTTAILLIILRGGIPDWLSVGLSSIFVIAGAFMGYLGLERFIGKRSSQVHNYVLLGVFILVHFYFVFVHPSLEARNLNVSLGLLVVCSQCAWLMLRRAGSGRTRITVQVGWVFALFCLVSLIRVFVILSIPEPSNDFFQSGFYDTLILMSYQALLILLTFGLVLMVNRRLLMQVKSQEEKFTRAFHSSPYAILITRLSDGLILDVNRGFEEIAGYLPSEAIGETTLNLHLWVNEADRQQVIAELSNTGEVQGREFQFHTKSGRELTGLYYAETLVVEGEQLILSSISDITERKQAEEIRRESEGRYRELIEHASDGIFIADASGKYIDVNSSGCTMLGYTRAEILKKTMRDLISSAELSSKPINMEALRAGKVVLNERQMVRKDGSLLSVEISGKLLPDGRLQGIVRDITERKQAEEEIKKLAKFPDENPYPVLRLNEKGFILYANTASRTLLEEWNTAIGREAPSFLRKKVTEALASKSKQVMEISIGARIMSFVVVPIIEENYVNLYGEDITERKQAEESLRESEDKFRYDFDYSIVGKSVTLISGEIQVNKAFCEMLSYSPEEFQNKKWQDITHPDDIELTQREIDTLLSGDKEAVRFTKRYLKKDGSIVWADVSTSLRRDKQGKPFYLMTNVSDITERKQKEEALHESDERFRSAFQTSVISMALVSTAGRWLKVNPSFCNFIGYSEDELLSKTFQDITHPDDLEVDLQHLRDLLDGKIDYYKMEKRYVHKEGKIIWGLLAVVPVRDSEGVPLYFLRQIQDITERKRAEDELRKARDNLELQIKERTAALSESNMLLQTLLDNIPDQIYFKDAESRFIRNSRAQATALGLSDPSQVVGKSDFDYFPHAQRSYDEEQEIIRSGKALVDFEEQVIWPSGRETWVSTTKVPLRDHDDKIIGTFGISRDITDRKRNEEALQKARDELEAFSYSVSHDLRAPLRGIDGWSLALLEDYAGQLDEQGQEYIRRVRSETQHMGQLIDDLLKLSRITRAEMHSDRVDLTASARSIARRLQEDEPQRHVEFIIQNGLSAIGDANLLEVMLTNLMSNAFKFTGKVAEARIEFGQMDMDGQRVFFVRDNGAGFDMAYAKKLFGAFQRMHKDSEFPGTGIGLATVQRIINRHGGRVWAESAVNQGATFFFTL